MDLEVVSGRGCIGQMQVQRGLLDSSKAAELGFICGSLPVPTASPPKAFSTQGVRLPQYKLLPGIINNSLDVARSAEDIWGGKWKSLGDKCDALAVSALSGHGDEIDVIAPADILKQLFKTPYSKARISVAVHRIGNTLVLNQGPDEDREKHARQSKNNVTLSEKLLYSKFVQQSMHHSSAPTPSCSSSESEFLPTAPSPRPCNIVDDEEQTSCCNDDLCATLRLPTEKPTNFWGDEKPSRNRPVHEPSFLDEETEDEYPEHETETQQRNADGFLRVLYWQFQNLRMLLGSDLLVFSNDKHVAVSLHLVETKQQVTPLMWLDAWLDNVMASVPELAICYHHKGAVQGYELLKTDDIFTLKGLSDDGSVFFQPHVVQQNALSVLKFLQENCKHDPGTYWLYKNAGEDVLQLFDLTGVSKTRNTDEMQASLPGSSGGANRYTLPLALLLYRVAYSLSHSRETSDVCKCAMLFRKCLEFLDHQEHLIIRAITHEQVARLILSCCKEHGSTTRPVIYLEAYEPDETSTSAIMGHLSSASSGSVSIEELSVTSDKTPRGTELVAKSRLRSPVVTDPIHARLAAVHHVSEAILSLRSQRQLQNVVDNDEEKSVVKRFPLCLCGGIECVTFYDIKSTDFGNLMDQKLRDLVMMLSDSYLALGEAYKEDGQLPRAVEAVKLACSVYGSFSDSASVPYGCKYCISEASGVASVQLVVPSGAATVSDGRQKGVFWDLLWRLIGDIYVKNILSSSTNRRSTCGELKLAEEIVKEVRRLKNKVGQKGCGVCCSDDCSCHAERISSGSSATSSNISSSGRSPRSKKSSRRFAPTSQVEEQAAAPSSRAEEQAAPPEDEPTNSSSSRKQREICRNHVCYHLQQVLNDDLTGSFMAALDCYDAAIYALRGIPGTSSQLREGLQKRGWACNEIGRRLFGADDLTLAEKAFRIAAEAFAEVGDVVNVVLILCNHGYAVRGSAEKLAALIAAGTFSAADALEHAISETKERYEKSLECYEAARRQVFSMKVEPKLVEEVVSQLANTYFRLGVFLATEELRVGQSFSADKAFSKALDLYKSAGRKQEAAFTHFNFGAHLSYCLHHGKVPRKTSDGKTSKFRQAEGHLQKAAAYYRYHHGDTFLDVQRTLCEMFTSFPNSHQMLDDAVSATLEGRHAFSESEVPSGKAVGSYLTGLQALFKGVLAATKTCGGSPEGPRTRVTNVCLLKEMYRIALRSCEGSLGHDLETLHKLWASS